jgi:hypothetical protein
MEIKKITGNLFRSAAVSPHCLAPCSQRCRHLQHEAFAICPRVAIVAVRRTVGGPFHRLRLLWEAAVAIVCCGRPLAPGCLWENLSPTFAHDFFLFAEARSQAKGSGSKLFGLNRFMTSSSSYTLDAFSTVAWNRVITNQSAQKLLGKKFK